MNSNLLKLGSVLVLSFPLPGWATGSKPLPQTERPELSTSSLHECQLTGELRFFRHIDPVTGHGAVSLFTEGKEIPLDFRQFKLDILLPSGFYVVKGHWSKEQHLVVTAAHWTGPCTLRLPE
jgi:hypothetical protein